MKIHHIAAVCVALTAAVPGALHAQLGADLGTLWAAKCPVRINEVMVNPRYDGWDEFIELYNASETTAVDIAGWSLTDGEDTDAIIDYTGIYDIGLAGTKIPPGGYALIVDRDYVGAYNAYMEDAGVLDNCIMACIDDLAIGNGLDNTADGITITTTWPLFRDRKYPRQTRSMSWDASYHLNIRSEMPSLEWVDPIDSWELCIDPHGSTPGDLNSRE